jgi:menaquinone-dependent protoporphyrinogen oxidase
MGSATGKPVAAESTGKPGPNGPFRHGRASSITEVRKRVSDMKVLVVFGSKRGGTAGLAAMVGEAFQREGWTAEVRAARMPQPVSDTDLVVVGGALYMNRWHKEARHFVRRNRTALRQLPVWLFSSGPLDDSARPGDLAAVPQLQEIAADIEARGHMTFGGRLEPDAKGFVAHTMAKKSAGDWRDPIHVAEWVHQIVHEFVPVVDLVPAQRTASEPVRVPSQRGRSRAPAANA